MQSCWHYRFPWGSPSPIMIYKCVESFSTSYVSYFTDTVQIQLGTISYCSERWGKCDLGDFDRGRRIGSSFSETADFSRKTNRWSLQRDKNKHQSYRDCKKREEGCEESRACLLLCRSFSGSQRRLAWSRNSASSVKRGKTESDRVYRMWKYSCLIG